MSDEWTRTTDFKVMGLTNLFQLFHIAFTLLLVALPYELIPTVPHRFHIIISRHYYTKILLTFA